MKTLIDRLAEATDHIEEFSRRIARLRAGEIHHQTRFGDGPWEDSTQFILAHYEMLLGTYKLMAEDLRQRVRAGEE